MAGGVAENLRFVGSGASSIGVAQTDRTLWLGGNRSSTQVQQAQPDNTFVQGAQTRHTLIADALPGGIGTADRDLVGWWVLIRTGAASGHVSRVSDYRQSDRRILLEVPCPADAGSGDSFSLYEPGTGSFPNVTADDSIDGSTLYRGLWFNNAEAGSFTGTRLHLESYGGKPTWFRFGFAETAASTTFTLADEETSPILPSGAYLSATGFGTAVPFGTHFGAGAAVPADGFTISPSTFCATFVERAIPASDPLRRTQSAAVGILFTSSASPNEVGGDLFVFDVAGFEATVVYSFSRNLFIAGGARGEVLLRSGATAVSGIPVKFGAIGPGTQVAPDDPTTDYGFTDANGIAQNAYRSPTDTDDAGRFVTGYAQINGAEPVGNPSSAVIEPAIDIVVTVAATLTVT